MPGKQAMPIARHSLMSKRLETSFKASKSSCMLTARLLGSSGAEITTGSACTRQSRNHEEGMGLGQSETYRNWELMLKRQIKASEKVKPTLSIVAAPAAESADWGNHLPKLEGIIRVRVRNLKNYKSFKVRRQHHDLMVSAVDDVTWRDFAYKSTAESSATRHRLQALASPICPLLTPVLKPTKWSEVFSSRPFRQEPVTTPLHVKHYFKYSKLQVVKFSPMLLFKAVKSFFRGSASDSQDIIKRIQCLRVYLQFTGESCGT
ncbi:hypothetical protein R3P38DRAFT_3376548 [Favolaschia claudopus]|uniref:Uncharacterized protein n=1 Tax=Favolaschia claudopus TaxID=2862362 RepID=A0AAV9ZEU5_9AGAR